MPADCMSNCRHCWPPPNPSPAIPVIFRKSRARTVFVKISDVDYIEAAAITSFCMPAAKHILRETLTNLESRSSPGCFADSSFRGGNLGRVAGVKPVATGEHVVVLRTGRELPLTRGVARASAAPGISLRRIFHSGGQRRRRATAATEDPRGSWVEVIGLETGCLVPFRSQVADRARRGACATRGGPSATTETGGRQMDFHPIFSRSHPIGDNSRQLPVVSLVDEIYAN